MMTRRTRLGKIMLFQPASSELRSANDKLGQCVIRRFLIAMGGNLPRGALAPADVMQSAVEKLRDGVGTSVRVSRFFRTPAFPAGSGPDYVNGAVELASSAAPEVLMAQLHSIEEAFGRARLTRWGARPLDLDLIAAGDVVLPDAVTQGHWRTLPLVRQSVESPDRLILPHPRVQDRAFVLVPLSDICPDWVHPILGMSVTQMCENLSQSDRDSVVPLAESACQ